MDRLMKQDLIAASAKLPDHLDINEPEKSSSSDKIAWRLTNGQKFTCRSRIDREIFIRLIFSLFRDPAESVLIMAFWMCLKDLKFGDIIPRLLALSDTLLSAIADEAAICLSCLQSSSVPPPHLAIDITLTAVTIGKSLSMKMIHQRKYSFKSGIKVLLKNLCADIFTDILVQIYPFRAVLNFPFTIPGFPHPTFGPFVLMPKSPDYVFPSEGIWGWSLNIQAPVDDRTMFLTFSRGYPVTEIEVKELFNSYYGDCVEEVCMEPPSSSDSSSTNQSLFARMVVREVSIIDRILSRGPIAKYRINGKHVWARKFERREA